LHQVRSFKIREHVMSDLLLFTGMVCGPILVLLILVALIDSTIRKPPLRRTRRLAVRLPKR
jgi:hypothetical protein